MALGAKIVHFVDYDMEDYTMDDYAPSECSTGFTPVNSEESNDFDCQLQKSPPLVTVKNTFIDGWAEDDEDHGIPVVSAKSCPVPKSNTLQDLDDTRTPRFACLLGRLPADAPAKAHRLAVQYLPNPSPDALPAYVWPQRLAAEMRPRAVSAFECDVKESVSQKMPSPANQARSRPLLPGVTPLDSRRPEISIGSSLHDAAECRPCAWFWRPQGCQNGQDCRHCHICTQDVVKARRKSKYVEQRKQGRAAQRAAAQGTRVAIGVPISAGFGVGVDGARCALQLTRFV